MSEIKTIVVNRSAYADNDLEAESLRSYLKEKGTFLVNLMSSPGSGKTTTLTRLINELKKDYRIGVMEADIDSDVDALKADSTVSTLKILTWSSLKMLVISSVLLNLIQEHLLIS